MEASMAPSARMVTPPYHHSIVSTAPTNLLYRGAIPALRNLHFIATLQLKTFVVLSKKSLEDDHPLLRWAKQTGVTIYWEAAEQMSEEKLGMGRPQVDQWILDTTTYPLYIADVDGKSHTTLVVACLRKLQGWHQDTILDEICRYQEDQEDLPLLPFVTAYLAPTSQETLTLPPPPYPSWIWPSASSEVDFKPSVSRPSQAFPSPNPPYPQPQTKDRPSSSLSAASSTSSNILPFPHPLQARKHPTMRLTFPTPPASSSNPTPNQSAAGQKDMQVASPVAVIGDGLARIPSRRERERDKERVTKGGERVLSPHPPGKDQTAPVLHVPTPTRSTTNSPSRRSHHHHHHHHHHHDVGQVQTAARSRPDSAPGNESRLRQGIGSPDEGVLGAAAHLMTAGLSGIAHALGATPPHAEDDQDGQNGKTVEEGGGYDDEAEEGDLTVRQSPIEALKAVSPSLSTTRDSEDLRSVSSATGTSTEFGMDTGASTAGTETGLETDEEEQVSEEEDEDGEDEDDEDEEDEEDEDEDDNQATSQFISALDLAGF
ncbi:hypothetical protein L198_00560 [Cryptococcus wingfieldii CBS 7118]|uniref:Putative tyrosine-protein phosphatase OCA1 n=1 Tax=Cryptococcus wingfieldii CBS 7118 TaxID=1295528 RepID=A0A1E3K8H9_9TREE|nr:hypothetical protein L198_00560 [Cryptococcus wingfieldii CBS 7118]ODO08827.1 hypothetical protein L198_00560 [Cryptococcus wingfieldii CBS 7118]